MRKLLGTLKYIKFSVYIGVICNFLFINILLLYSDENLINKKIIDFTKIENDFWIQLPNQEEIPLNTDTLININDNDEEPPEFLSLLPGNSWKIKSNIISSSKELSIKISQFIASSETKIFDIDIAKKPLLHILGYINFDLKNIIIEPPFDIPINSDKTVILADASLITEPKNIGKNNKFEGFGVAKNLNLIDSISIIICNYGSDVNVKVAFDSNLGSFLVDFGIIQDDRQQIEDRKSMNFIKQDFSLNSPQLGNDLKNKITASYIKFKYFVIEAFDFDKVDKEKIVIDLYIHSLEITYHSE